MGARGWGGAYTCAEEAHRKFTTPSALQVPVGRPGMSDVSYLSGISGLSFDSNLLSPFLFFLPSPVTLSVSSFFLLPAGPFSLTFSRKFFKIIR